MPNPSEALDISATALVASDLLKVLAILPDTTVRKSQKKEIKKATFL